MKNRLPTNLLVPELEYFEFTWGKKCVCHKNCEKGFEKHRECKKLLSEFHRLKGSVEEAYVSSGIDMSKEYDNLCGSNWSGSVVSARCNILSQLGARSTSEISYYNILGIVILIFTFYFWFQKKKGQYLGSLADVVGRLFFLAVIGAISSVFGIFGALAFSGLGQVVPIFISVPLTITIFILIFSKRILSRRSLIISSLIFSLASNFWLASLVTTTVNSSRSVDASHWQLSENISINEKIRKILGEK